MLQKSILKNKIKIVTKKYEKKKGFEKFMCGIVGYIGKRNAKEILIHGLKKLEYRGYDSAGIAYLENHKIILKKSVGRIGNLEEKIDFSPSSSVGIGHTRWATHGGVTIKNCHPHQVKQITLVHNGILENEQELREILKKKGYSFQSDTDTEVIAGYLDYLWQEEKNSSFVTVLEEARKIFKGSFALVIMVQGIEDQLFVLKKDSPLVIGLGEEENFIASDFSAYLEETRKYIILEDNWIGVVWANQVTLYQKGEEIPAVVKEIDQEMEENSLLHFDHYMLKEIQEQSSLIQKWNKIYFEEKENLPDITWAKRIDIVACGTAYHAGLIGKYLIEENSHLEVHVYIASEYRYQKVFLDQDSLVIAISQSGETADTLACIKMAKKYQAKTLGIINVFNSSIARVCDMVVYTKAGLEVSVASTKAYTSQVFVLGLLAQEFLGEKKNTDLELSKKIENLTRKDYSSIVQNLYLKKDIFFLGRNIDYVTALEGSLKLKEITYLHSEAFPAGELKHGPISLIEEKTPVIAIITKKEFALKTISNVREVKARGAYVILVISRDILSEIGDACYDEVIILPEGNLYTNPILSIIPLQLLAYYTAKKRGLDIDKPRNLAKSVTVE